MALKIKRLTDKTVKANKAKGLHPDGHGLYLQVGAKGSRSWIFRYKRQGRARDMGLGSFPDVSLAKARELAAGAREDLAAGKDPIAERDARRAQERLAMANGTTFRRAAEEYVAAQEAGWRNEKHRHQWRQTLRDYAYPVIGDMAVADIGVADVRAVLEPIWMAKTETAARVRGRIETIIDAARADDDSRWSNPARWERHKHKFLQRSKVAPTRHHPALPYKELPAFMATLRAGNSITARALEFVILTACRSGEVRGARWDEIDLSSRLWTIPGERMKGGEEHSVPLSTRAVAILKELAAVRTGDLVFPGERRGQPLHERTLLMALGEFHKCVTVHGFRSSFRTWAEETTAFPNFLSEMALAHTSGDKVRKAYARGMLLKKRHELMDAWARHCEPRQPGKRRTSPRQASVASRKIRIRRVLPIRQPIPRAANS